MFQIYIPSLSENPEELVRVGLGDMVAGANSLRVSGTGAPDGETGVLWWWHRFGRPTFGYKPDQTWVSAYAAEGFDGGRYLIDVTSPLTPERLKRSTQVPGTWTIGGDGNRWLIPSVTTLPRDWIPMPDGSWGSELPAQYNDLAIAASEMAFRLLTDGENLPRADVGNFILKFLQLNYSMTPEVLAATKLINDQNAANLFRTALKPELSRAMAETTAEVTHV